MRVGWVGYNTLQRSTMAPIGAIDQYYTVLPALRDLLSEPVHWMQLKHLDATCDQSDPGTCETDEVEAFASVCHYGDCFLPLMRWVNALPTTGRWDASVAQPFDIQQLKYQIPELDVVIVEATGQMGAAYGIDVLLRLLYQRNSNIGFLIFDQDLASPTVKSKMRKWHPEPDLRTITATHYTLDRYPTQVVALSPHLEYRNRPPCTNIRGVAYVGNDYKRREPMLRLMSGPWFHHYGRIKPDFMPELTGRGVHVHGPVVPTRTRSIEDIYCHHGAGLHCLREDAYRLNLIAVRLSEIARAGCVAFCDHKLAIGRTLSSPWACVQNAREIVEKVEYLRRVPTYLADLVQYQQGALGYYTSTGRYATALFQAIKRLAAGPIGSTWKYNLYGDLMEQSGLQPWGEPSRSEALI